MMHPKLENVPCPQCGCRIIPWQVRWEVMRDGRDAFPYCCIECGYRSSIVESHSKVYKALELIGMNKEDIAREP